MELMPAELAYEKISTADSRKAALLTAVIQRRKRLLSSALLYHTMMRVEQVTTAISCVIATRATGLRLWGQVVAR